MKKFAMIALSVLLAAMLLFGCEQSSSEKTLNVLAIGSYGKDIMTYVEPLAESGGYTVNAAYLDLPGSSLRDISAAMVSNSEAFTYYEAEGIEFTAQAGVTAEKILAKDWDVVILQQAVVYSGFQSTYNEDFEYVIDYVSDKTQARIYWNMSWTAENSFSDDALRKFFSYYEYDNNIMYNAIVDCLETNVVGNGAFDGWIPSGTAIKAIRDQLGSVTEDGHTLQSSAAMAAASLATLKTLLPDYDLTKAACDSLSEDEMETVRAAVDSACKVDSVPEKTEVSAIPVNENADITVGQVAAPMRLHFPDLTVLDDGTVVVGAYENVYHKPVQVLDNYQLGGGRLIVWTSNDNGATWNYDEPLLIVDEKQIEQWGLAKISDRYETVKSGSSDYVVTADPRDPNFSTVHADMDGDGDAEEVLLFTFWIQFYTETKTVSKCYMIHSTDGGSTWSAPQILQTNTGGNVIKRGDIASFSDGQILIPYYTATQAGAFLMEFDPALGEWTLLLNSEIINFEPDESEDFNEVSLVATDPDGDTVYAYCRENGIILRSDNRGIFWEYVANEDGLIHQPGFTVLDETHAYVTWALTAVRPRPTYGKVFDVTAGWEATEAELLYASPVEKSHDTGDPSCALLNDGRVLVISYDTAFRSVVGVYVDPEV